MEFESSDIESSGLGNASEGPKEYSEKQKEQYRRAQSQLQKTKKDESKAKGDKEVLFQILSRFIQNPYYEEFIPIITDVLSKEAPARLIMSLISLVYPEAALYVLQSLGRKQDIEILLSLHRYEKRCDLDESILHPSIRNWMNTWSYTSKMFLIDEGSSAILIKKLDILLSGKEGRTIIEAFAFSLTFFFSSRNVIIEKNKALSFAEFIIREYQASIKNYLRGADSDLVSTIENPEHSRFFGLDGPNEP